jgi:ABC-type lipoprotein release transport system permease subunit
MDLMISTVIDTKNESDERDRDGKIKINHSYQVINVTLVGIVNSPDPMNNTSVAWMPLSVLQDEAGMMLEGAITELLIRKKNAALGALPGKDESPERITSCLNLPQTLSVYRWEDYSEDFLSVSRGDSMSSTIMIAMLFLLSFLGIANTMLMAILERTKEFGMMRSLGMTDSQLVFITMAEAACIGITGSLFGVIIGCAINVYMVEYGIDYSAMMDNFEADYGYRIIAVFKSAWNPAVIIAAPIVATVLSALMAFFPSKRAVKMEITACLRCD